LPMRSNVLAGSPVLRFAPSPNGLLHLGHAYSAFCNERVAADLNGRLLLRIEDLDRTRCKPRYQAAIEEDLAWLGLRFETPARRQSEHAGDYAAALDGLAAREFVYACFCSRAEVARTSQGRDPDGAPLYSGICRALVPSWWPHHSVSVISPKVPPQAALPGSRSARRPAPAANRPAA